MALVRRSRSPGILGTNRAIRAVWTATTTTLVGSQVTVFALPAIAVLVLDASALSVALIPAVQYGAIAIVASRAGRRADRSDRPRLMRTANAAGVAVSSVPLASAFDVLTLAQLYVVAVMVGATSAVFDTASQSLIPHLVTQPELSDANARLELSRSTAQVVGPQLGGAAIQLVGAPAAMVLDAASYLASSTMVRGLTDRPTRHDKEVHGPPVGAAATDRPAATGLRIIWADPMLRRGVRRSCLSPLRRSRSVVHGQRRRRGRHRGSLL